MSRDTFLKPIRLYAKGFATVTLRNTDFSTRKRLNTIHPPPSLTNSFKTEWVAGRKSTIGMRRSTMSRTLPHLKVLTTTTTRIPVSAASGMTSPNVNGFAVEGFRYS